MRWPGLKRGDLVPSRGNGRCYGCHLPWWAADPTVSVQYTCDEHGCGSGQFTMGLGCWLRATVEERIEAHMALCDEWERGWRKDGYTPADGVTIDVIRERVATAIRADDVELPRMVRR